ncbi:MAG TPA: hypothetical protein PKA54_03655 [Chitinophagaceae bacterium]|nr:MAG: hypothetical protein UZ11_BCD004001761 [Bacteroidetes bacterium OLB11]HMN32443.1 hypothetical protein [Chitinophagaceae bacterium]
MKCKKYIFFILLMTIGFTKAYTQDVEIESQIKPIHDKDISKLSKMEILEDTLVYLTDSMYYSAFPENRSLGCYDFIRILKNAFNETNSYNYSYNKLKNYINIFYSPDKSFRMYNWEVVKSAAERRYYAVIQMSNGKTIPLIDVSDQIIRGGEDSILMNNRWFGALYYNIIQKEIGNDKIYFLLGWNGASLNSEKKIVEPFGFNSNGQAVFGAPLFNIFDKGKRKSVNRFVYEYQRGSKVHLNLDVETDQIIFDHCESQIGDPNKKFTYIPDGSYDALSWDGRYWNMILDIIKVVPREQGDAPVEKPIK